jgi:transposase
MTTTTAMMTVTPGFVIGGVDTHLDVHVAAALDHLGGVLGTASFPTTSVGYEQLLEWLQKHGPIERIGVEGTGSYGSGLAQYLGASGMSVIEVSRPSRQVRRRHGKSDVIDAIAAARAVLAGEARTVPKSHDGAVEALRALKLLQRSANKARVVALNQLHNLIVTAPDEVRSRLRDLPRQELLSTCAAFRIRAEDVSLTAITRFSLRELAHRVAHLDAELEQTKRRIDRLTTALAPQLLAIHGVGPDVASTLLVTAGDNPDRMRHEKSFASLCGTSPLQASSGKRTRHRLNRGGDRQANAALWRIAIVRMGTDPRTRDYVSRRVAEGKNKPEIIRCLKRYIAREVFNAILSERRH